MLCSKKNIWTGNIFWFAHTSPKNTWQSPTDGRHAPIPSAFQETLPQLFWLNTHGGDEYCALL
jgi:hypothetical protein